MSKNQSIRSFFKPVPTPNKTPSNNNTNSKLTPSQIERIEHNKAAAKLRLLKLSNKKKYSSNNLNNNKKTPLNTMVNPQNLIPLTSNRKRNISSKKQPNYYESPPKKKFKKGNISSDDEYDPNNDKNIINYDNNYNINNNYSSEDDIIVSPKKKKKFIDINMNNNNNGNDMKMESDIEMNDNENDGLKKLAMFAVNSNKKFDYKCRDWKSIKNQKKNVRKSPQKAAGASHRMISNKEWYKNKKDINGNPIGSKNYDGKTLYIPKRGGFDDMTPGQQQYWKYKQYHMDGILFWKTGKFYELYDDDALKAQELFGLKLIGGGCPHSGFPEQSLDKYQQGFVDHGLTVYRVEQMETKEQMKLQKRKIMKRECVEVVSKGTKTDMEIIDSGENNYVLFIRETIEQKENMIYVCFADLSIGEINIGNYIDDKVLTLTKTLIQQIMPSQVMYVKDKCSSILRSLIKKEVPSNSVKTGLKDNDWWDIDKVKKEIEINKYWNLDKKADLPLLFNNEIYNNIELMKCFGGFLHTLTDAIKDKEILPKSHWIKYDSENFEKNDYMILDGSTLKNLEILKNEMGHDAGTLIKFLDKTQTSFGSRKMKKWVRYPLKNIKMINDRLAAIEYIMNCQWIEIVCEILKKKIPDLERLLGSIIKAGTYNRLIDKANMFESMWNERKVERFIKMIEGLDNIINIVKEINKQRSNNDSLNMLNNITTFGNKLPNYIDILNDIKNLFDWETAKNEKLLIPKNDDEYTQVIKEIDEIELQLTDIINNEAKKLRINPNKVNVWSSKTGKKEEIFLLGLDTKEAKNKKLDKNYPNNWIHYKSTNQQIRYRISSQIKLLDKREILLLKKDELLITASTRVYAKFAEYHNIWRQVIECVSDLDCLISLARVSSNAPFDQMCRPQFINSKNGKNILELRNSVHPCIYGNGIVDNFVANDIIINSAQNQDATFLMITGPNMGGKSTLLRQTCINVILAHIGCYVAAKQCKLTVVDRIFTRVGANDNILSGQSTFMIELQETANIIKNATKNSIVILDELGRGTSTFDGTSIAYAVAQHLINEKQCRTLFSTHYHGLTESFQNNKNVKHYYMNFKKENENIIFLYKFIQGTCKHSHGVYCAKLAGLNDDILKIAQEKSEELRLKMHGNENINKLKSILMDLNLSI